MNLILLFKNRQIKNFVNIDPFLSTITQFFGDKLTKNFRKEVLVRTYLWKINRKDSRAAFMDLFFILGS